MTDKPVDADALKEMVEADADKPDDLPPAGRPNGRFLRDVSGPVLVLARDLRGKLVRDSFVAHAHALSIEQPETPEWPDLPEHVREMYRRIGDSVVDYMGKGEGP
jgi:hypothetical protein